MPCSLSIWTVRSIPARYSVSKTPGSGSTAVQMIPSRTTLNPLLARNCASSSPKPIASGS